MRKEARVACSGVPRRCSRNWCVGRGSGGRRSRPGRLGAGVDEGKANGLSVLSVRRRLIREGSDPAVASSPRCPSDVLQAIIAPASTVMGQTR